MKTFDRLGLMVKSVGGVIVVTGLTIAGFIGGKAYAETNNQKDLASEASEMPMKEILMVDGVEYSVEGVRHLHEFSMDQTNEILTIGNAYEIKKGGLEQCVSDLNYSGTPISVTVQRAMDFRL